MVARGVGACLVLLMPIFLGCNTEPCEPLPNDGITVFVRDAETGAPAAEGATAEVSAIGFSETLVRADELRFGGVSERPGVYRLVVSKLGYATFKRDNIEVEEGECHVETVEIEVLLERI